MTRTSRRALSLVAPLLAAAALALTALTPTSAGAASLDDLVVHVNRTTGLDDGSKVHAVAHHLPADTTFDVRLCDALRTDDGFGTGCAPIGSVTSNAAGNASTSVRLPAYQLNDDEYEGHPVYCRNDGCHLYFSTTDEDGNQHGASSRALQFVGSTATVQASPSENLPKVKRVRVSGTAFGAEGRTVLVRETACTHRPSGGYQCNGDRSYAATTVDSTGHYSTTYVVRRRVAGYDCATGGFYSCGVTAVVLDAQGHHDNTFGNSDGFGDPTAYLDFRE